MQYRNSPLKYIGYSPSQLLMSRTCKTKIPIVSNLLKPQLCMKVSEKLNKRQGEYKKYYNRNAKNLPPLQPNDNVTVYNHVQKLWEPGVIINKHPHPRSYVVKNKSGNLVRRNRVDLKKSVNKYTPLPEDYDCALFEQIPDNIEQSTNTLPSSSNGGESSYKADVRSEIPPSRTRSGRISKAPEKLNL